MKSTYFIFVLFFILLCLISTAKATEEEDTQRMIDKLIKRYGEDNLRYYVPCLLHASCANCTSGLF
jgi:hypothetical protein